MTASKHLISGLAATAFVTMVGLAYAQTTPAPATSEATSPQSSSTTPSTTPSTTGSNDSANTSSTSEPAPQVDRN